MGVGDALLEAEVGMPVWLNGRASLKMNAEFQSLDSNLFGLSNHTIHFKYRNQLDDMPQMGLVKGTFIRELRHYERSHQYHNWTRIGWVALDSNCEDLCSFTLSLG